MNSEEKYNKWFKFDDDKVNVQLANEFNRVFADLLQELNIEPMRTK